MTMSTHTLELIIFFISVRLVIAGANSGSEEISYASELNVTSIFGRNATLTCSYNASTGNSVAWIRYDTRTILTMQDNKVTQSSHYSLENKRDSSDLLITNITETDAGVYICQINTEPTRNHIFRLVVQRPPWNLTSNLRQRKFETKLGNPVGLTCSAKGKPKPKITWKRRDNKPLRILDKEKNFRLVYSKHGETLKLYNVRREDAGEIMCIANNSYLPIISRQFKLVVTYKPAVEIGVTLAKRRNSATGYNGFDQPVFIIKCMIDAIPMQFYNLTIEGKPIPHTQKKDRRDRLILKYSTNEKSHLGKQVKCSAKNHLGNAVNYAEIPDSFPPGNNNAVKVEAGNDYYGAQKESGYYKSNGDANDCSNPGCRTMVTIKEEGGRDVTNQREAQSNPSWDYPNERSPEYKTNIYNNNRRKSKYESDDELIEFDDYEAYGSMGTTFKEPYKQTIILCYLLLIDGLLLHL